MKRLTEADPELAITAPATATERGSALGPASVDDLKALLLRLARAARNSFDLRGDGLATPRGAGAASAYQAPPEAP